MAEVKLNSQIILTPSNELKDLLATIENPSEQIKTALAKNEITPDLLKDIRSRLMPEDKKVGSQNKKNIKEVLYFS